MTAEEHTVLYIALRLQKELDSRAFKTMLFRSKKIKTLCFLKELINVQKEHQSYSQWLRWDMEVDACSDQALIDETESGMDISTQGQICLSGPFINV